MSYNPALYQPTVNNPYAGIGNNYSLYNNTGVSNMPGVNQPVYPQFTPPPLTLSAAYTKGEIGASSYPVAGGNTVVLLDSDTIDTDNPIIYIKTTGYDGKPQTIKKISGVVSYPNEQGLFTTSTTEVVKEIEKVDINLDDYVTKNELNEIKDNVDLISVQLDDYEKALNNINEIVSNIDKRFNSMFNVFNNNSVDQSSNNTQPNQLNQNNKKNKNVYKKDGD